MSTEKRTEKILVLYGSQTGNSEQAAIEFGEQCAAHLSTGTVEVQAVPMQLDDFLELQHAAWTRLVVIFVSSYGVGGPPLGSYRFRELCDAWRAPTNAPQGHTSAVSLKGVSFALCGLGDSKYTTYFQNPTAIDEGLRAVGALRVGPLGQADASSDKPSQPEVIASWIREIWPHLATVIATPPVPDAQLQEMQQTTMALCQIINPDYKSAGSKQKGQSTDGSSALIRWLILAVLVGMIAFLLPYLHALQ